MIDEWTCIEIRVPIYMRARAIVGLYVVLVRVRIYSTWVDWVSIAYLVIGANGIVRGKKVTSLARWPPNPSRCWAPTWRTNGPMEDYWARSGGLLAEWPLSTLGGVFPLTRLTWLARGVY